ncbi:hypothetical protein JCM21738_3167 [Mesobacillus boroniphilus JCM 21738]|uniref:Uncharacterized protein n=1 Tax=Mesobacillus boroniphilus JCM 21738 TaxID=1294265 RepID=W4RQW8_9BACI|nr:hypothetical protein JCM21738_3167 [Mesobacillus boroniphilus JCM 21738]
MSVYADIIFFYDFFATWGDNLHDFFIFTSEIKEMILFEYKKRVEVPHVRMTVYLLKNLYP